MCDYVLQNAYGPQIFVFQRGILITCLQIPCDFSPPSPHFLDHDFFDFSLYICPSNPFQPKRQWLESTEILRNLWIIHHTFLEFCPPGWLSARAD